MTTMSSLRRERHEWSVRAFAPAHAVAIALEHFGGTASVMVLTR
jgi:hypothetical protein